MTDTLYFICIDKHIGMTDFLKKVDHMIFQCKTLKNEREILKKSVLRVGNWPVSKSELTNRNLKQLDT